MGLGVPPRIGAGHSVLPTRDGVGASCVALPEGPWVSMLEFLAQRFPRQGRSLWARRMQDGEVVDEHGQPVAIDRPYQARLRLYYYRSLEAEPRIPFDEVVLHQDAHLVVVDKPHFLPVVPSGPYLQETVLVRLKQKLGIDALVPRTASTATPQGWCFSRFSHRAVASTAHCFANTICARPTRPSRRGATT